MVGIIKTTVETICTSLFETIAQALFLRRSEHQWRDGRFNSLNTMLLRFWFRKSDNMLKEKGFVKENDTCRVKLL